MMEVVRLLVAEDDPKLRDLLEQLLSTCSQIRLVATAADGEEAVQKGIQYEPNVVLMDIGMPRMSGIEATRRLKRVLPGIQIVIWTIYGDDHNVFEAIKAGAISYLLKDSPTEEIVAGILAASRGESLLHPSVAVRVLQEFQRVLTQHSEAAHYLSELTERETEILRLIAEGKRNKEIAETLFLTEKTVKNHITNILFKLQVNSRTEAALLALKQGLI